MYRTALLLDAAAYSAPTARLRLLKDGVADSVPTAGSATVQFQVRKSFLESMGQ